MIQGRGGGVQAKSMGKEKRVKKKDLIGLNRVQQPLGNIVLQIGGHIRINPRDDRFSL